MSKAPKKLSECVARKLIFLPESKIPIAGVLGGPPFVQRGQIRTAADGQRIVLHAGGEGVYFLLVARGSADAGYVFFEDADDFCKDIRDYVFIRAGRGAQGMAYVAETSIEFLMGVAAAASGIAFVAIVTLDIVKFIEENKVIIGKIGRLLIAWQKASTVLQVLCPTVHAKLKDAIWRGAKEMLPAVGTAAKQTAKELYKIPTAKEYARMAGAIIGILGGKVALLRQSSLARGVLDVLRTLAQTAVKSVLKGAPKVGAKDALVLEQLVVRLTNAGVAISQNEGRVIAAEVQRNAKQLQPVLEELFVSLVDLEHAK